MLASAGLIMVAPDSPFNMDVTVPVSHGVHGSGAYSNTPLFREEVSPCRLAFTESALPVILQRIVHTPSELSTSRNSTRPMAVTGVIETESERMVFP